MAGITEKIEATASSVGVLITIMGSLIGGAFWLGSQSNHIDAMDKRLYAYEVQTEAKVSAITKEIEVVKVRSTKMQEQLNNLAANASITADKVDSQEVKVSKLEKDGMVANSSLERNTQAFMELNTTLKEIRKDLNDKEIKDAKQDAEIARLKEKNNA